MTARRSRLSRYKKKQEKRKAVIYILLSGIFLYGMIRWGIPGIINVIGWWTSSDEIVSEQGYKVPPQKPQLAPLPEATFSGKISVSGTAILGKKVEIYVNGDKRNEKDLTEGSNFEFESVVLNNGKNTIEIISKNDSGDSQPARAKITRDDAKPEITIDEPGLEAERYGPGENNISIRGTVNEEGRVYVNNHLVFVSDEGNFTFDSDLDEGLNKFVVKAIDKAGNESEKLVRVTYSR